MIAVVELKHCMDRIYIFYIVIYKFYYRQKLYLVILLPIDKNLEISLHNTILPLSLAICSNIKDDK